MQVDSSYSQTMGYLKRGVAVSAESLDRWLSQLKATQRIEPLRLVCLSRKEQNLIHIPASTTNTARKGVVYNVEGYIKRRVPSGKEIQYRTQLIRQ